MTYILYVEDNEDNIYMLKRRLERRGFELGVASDGEEALRMANARTPALILMDLILPGIDGWETTRRLRRNPALDGFGLIAFASLFPMITVMGYAQLVDWWSNRRLARSQKRIEP